MRTDQSELSIKVLLKQVYAAHSNKVKGLEDEVEELKSKLIEAESKLGDGESDCKRCVELEKAFKSCQAALHEQSKWFENLGQKFSVFDHSESKTSSTKTTKESNDIPKFQNEISSVSHQSNFTEKSSVAKQNLLKNLMSLNPEEYQDSLDLSMAPLPINLLHEYSTLNYDSMILVPDSLDIVNEIHSDVKLKRSLKDIVTDDPKLIKTKNMTMIQIDKKSDKSVNVEDKLKECLETNKPPKKRSLMESAVLDSNAKRPHIGSVNGSDCSSNNKESRPVIKNRGPEVTPVDTKSLKDKFSPKQQNHSEKKSGPAVAKNADPKNMKSSTTSDNSNSKSPSVANNANLKKKYIPELDIETHKGESIVSDKFNTSTEAGKVCVAKMAATASKDSMYQVSPSLLPVNNKKENKLPIKQLLGNEDIYDFQTRIVNKKHLEEDGSWAACDKKKLKKDPIVKVKSTSKFKMSLDSLPANYKKPVFRQTKLSKSIFQTKSSNENPCEENILDSDINLFAKKNNQIWNSGKCNGKSSTIDFDATCIPDNYEYRVYSSSGLQRKNSKENDVVILDSESIDDSLNDSIASPVLITENCVSKSSKSKFNGNNKEEAKFEDFLKESNENVVSMNSFDRLPKREEPNYKYKEETVRKKADRKQLNAFDCKECEKYYAELGLSDKEKQERMKQCSRHRSKFAPPPTPEHFWEVDFPDTQECKARGYLNETQKVKLKTLRRKPL